MTDSIIRDISRERLLWGVLFAFIIVTAIALWEVLGTIFLAITVAYVLTPLRRWLRRRGLPRIAATIIVTVTVLTGVLAVLVPIFLVLFVRLDEFIALLDSLPEEIRVEYGELHSVIILDDILVLIQAWVTDAAISASAALPELLMKFALFLFVVLALLHTERHIAQGIMRVVPPRHRDIASSLHQRASDTLMGIYVLQGVTGVATTIIALPVFYFLGYDAFVVLAIIAGVLQFVPLIGPSLLIAALTVGEIMMGDLVGAVLILVIGGAVVAAAPDVVIRPKLATYTAGLNSVLYFIGFVGGLLSLGAIGVILGPLLVALLVESMRLLSEWYEAEVPNPVPIASDD